MTGAQLLEWLIAQPDDVLACDVFSRGAKYGELLPAAFVADTSWLLPDGRVRTIMIEGAYSE